MTHLVGGLHVPKDPGGVLAQAEGGALLAGQLHPLHIPWQPPYPSLYHVLPALMNSNNNHSYNNNTVYISLHYVLPALLVITKTLSFPSLYHMLPAVPRHMT